MSANGPRGFISTKEKIQMQTSILSHGQGRDIIKKQQTIHLFDAIGWIAEYWNQL